MTVRYLEIRDSMTFIPALAVRLGVPGCEAVRYLLHRLGYGATEVEQANTILLVNLVTCESQTDPNIWKSQTMKDAHVALIVDLTPSLETQSDGAVWDVEYLKGQSLEPKLPEREEEMESMRARLAAIKKRVLETDIANEASEGELHGSMKAIRELLQEPASQPFRGKDGRSDPEVRSAHSVRMKQYWAERRAERRLQDPDNNPQSGGERDAT